MHIDVLRESNRIMYVKYLLHYLGSNRSLLFGSVFVVVLVVVFQRLNFESQRIH